MKNSILSILLRFAIVIIGLCGVAVCALWYPFTISVSVTGGVTAELTLQQNIEFWTQLSFYWLCSIPCFIVLIFFWQVTSYIARDKAFSQQTAKALNRSAVLLFADIVLFLIGNIVFLALQWNWLAVAYFFIAIIGVVIATVLLVLAQYVSKASVMKEEYDETI